MKESVIVIPARLDSKRLENKMLLNETGIPLVMETYFNAVQAIRRSNYIKDVWITTDSPEIAMTCRTFDEHVKIIESGECYCGTQRVLRSMQTLDYFLGKDCYNIINLQADYPRIDADALDRLAQALYWQNDAIHTLYYLVPNVGLWQAEKYVKIATNSHNEATFFSRCPIPHNATDLKIHIGVYGFPWKLAAETLEWYEKGLTPHNVSENLEQLLWLEKWNNIICHQTYEAIGIDTRADYERFANAVNDKELLCGWELAQGTGNGERCDY